MRLDEQGCVEKEMQTRLLRQISGRKQQKACRDNEEIVVKRKRGMDDMVADSGREIEKKIAKA